jgi:hypothetical protein
MKSEQSSVTFRVPDFIDSDGIEYTDIEVIVEMDGDIRDTVHLVTTLERPLTERKCRPRNGTFSPWSEASTNQGAADDLGQDHQAGTYKR